MKKPILLSSITLLGLLFFIYFSESKQAADIPNLTIDHSDFFEIYKKDCVLYSSENDGSTYRNSPTGLHLHYPTDTIICEKHNPFESESGLDVMVWNKSDFNQNIPTLPLAIIYFDNTLLENLPQPTVVSTKEVTIGNETISVDTVKSPECLDDICLFYQKTSFNKNDHSIKIEILSDKISWTDFSFE